MSSIGSGPGIGTGLIEISGVRAVSGTDPRPVATTSTTVAQQPAAHSNEAAAMVSSTVLNAGEMPVDSDRVSVIRKAIQSGNYPLFPTKISDAMIAAGILLQVRN